ncbi:MAG: nucleoside triphosphate pyrophosphohydrolase [Desulfuromonadales bacterium]|nr:nucleoside triphosphate pyrophosphohydrolase [Desulfuromonadales bacterium]
MNKSEFDKLVEIMHRLRTPGGCPWDAEQTHETLKRYLLEETYEVIEAIDKKDPALLKEELGDLMLQPVFHSAIAEEKGEFTINDVIKNINEKLIRRHPHVFGDADIKTSDEQITSWEKIKKIEKGAERKSAISGIPPHLPALMKAQKITEKAARVGFDWENREQVKAKVYEELHELEEAIVETSPERIEAEFGDLLFAIVNMGRFLSINSEEALRKTIDRFKNRFEYIETSLQELGKDIKEASLDEMEALWEKAKGLEKSLK